MKKNVTFSILALTALAVSAQITNTVPVPAPVGSVNPVASSLWSALIVAVVPVVVMFIKKYLPALPKLTWPILATLLGVGADWVLAKSGMIPHSTWELGALCGAAGVGLREISKQILALVVTDQPEPKVG